MKFLFLIFSLFLCSSAYLSPKFSETFQKVNISKWYRPQTHSILTEIVKIIQDIIKNIEGVHTINIPEFSIDTLNRLENININFTVNETSFIFVEKPRNLNISNLTIPVSFFLANGEYDFEGISLLGLDIYGKGDFRIRLEELRLFLALEISYSASKGWRVVNLNAKTSMNECQIDIENLMNGEPMGDFLNFMVNEILKILVELLEGFVQEYNEEIKKELSDFINKLMGN